MKRLVITAAAVAAMAAGAAVAVHVTGSQSDPIFEANVEALTNGEGGLSDPVWDVYHRPDGGFNCTRGGNETC